MNWPIKVNANGLREHNGALVQIIYIHLNGTCTRKRLKGFWSAAVHGSKMLALIVLSVRLSLGTAPRFWL